VTRVLGKFQIIFCLTYALLWSTKSNAKTPLRMKKTKIVSKYLLP